MMKKKKIVISIVCIAILTGTILFRKGNIVNINAEDTNIGIIQTTTMQKYGDISLISEDHGYNELFGESLVEYRDESYVYLINPSSGYIKAIMLAEKKNDPLFEQINSFEEAEHDAELIAQRACNNFFTADYDIFSNLIGEGDKQVYSMELWEKVSDDFYTGNKIAIVLTADGYLDSLIVRSSAPILSMYGINDYISKEEAIRKAYEEATLIANNREQIALANTQNEDQEIQENEAIVSDAALLGISESTHDKESTDSYDIFIENRENHVVNAYKQFENGLVEWVVTIENVQTNANLGEINFKIKVNALTGETIFATSTR